MHEGNAGHGVIGGLNGLYDAFAFKPTDVDIDDVFTTLSHQCRFGGRGQRFYSVAQHSLLTARIAYDMADGHPKRQRIALGALCHDFAEAYIGDIVKPLKVLIPGIERIEAAILHAISVTCEIGLTSDPIVKRADDVALYHEAVHLGFPVDEWSFSDELRASVISPMARNVLACGMSHQWIRRDLSETYHRAVGLANTEEYEDMDIPMRSGNLGGAK